MQLNISLFGAIHFFCRKEKKNELIFLEIEDFNFNAGFLSSMEIEIRKT